MSEHSRARRFHTGRNYAVWIYPDRSVTILDCGCQAVATKPDPIDDGWLEATADLGYGDDVLWRVLEHDLLHSWLAERLGMNYSAALWAQCHDVDAWRTPGSEDTEKDEARVYGVQAALNGVPWGMDRLSGLYGQRKATWLVEGARKLLRPSGQAMTREWAAQRIYGIQ